MKKEEMKAKQYLYESLIKDLEYCFVGLTEEEKALLVYRKIAGLKNEQTPDSEIFLPYQDLSKQEKVQAIVIASNTNIF